MAESVPPEEATHHLPSQGGTGWHQVEANRCYSGDEIYNIPATTLAPPWRMFLLGDGSPTRHLRLLSGSPTTVEVIEQREIGNDLDGAPSSIRAVEGPRVRRQVWLQNERGERLGYACSWWPAAQVNKHLQNKSLPIWLSLARRRTEIYREILEVYSGSNKFLSSAFGSEDKLWGRHYLFWHRGKPLTLIYEVFSPLLAAYLGMVRLPRELQPAHAAATPHGPRSPAGRGAAAAGGTDSYATKASGAVARRAMDGGASKAGALRLSPAAMRQQERAAELATPGNKSPRKQRQQDRAAGAQGRAGAQAVTGPQAPAKQQSPRR